MGNLWSCSLTLLIPVAIQRPSLAGANHVRMSIRQYEPRRPPMPPTFLFDRIRQISLQLTPDSIHNPEVYANLPFLPFYIPTQKLAQYPNPRPLYGGEQDPVLLEISFL